MQKRIIWLDVARALGIILVVFGHTERGLGVAGIFSSPIRPQIDFAIYSFHMQLFFFLSGLNVLASRNKEGFFQNRATAIIVPYFVFSAVQGVLKMVLAGQTNTTTSLQDLLLIPIYPMPPFWFLYVLLFYVALITIFNPGKRLMVVAVCMALISPFMHDLTKWPLFQILYFFPFYVAGVLYTVQRIPTWIGVGAVLFWFVSCLLAICQKVPPSNYYALYMIPTAISGITAVLWISQRIEKVSDVLSFIGKNVIAIYVMHILATAGARIILVKLGIESPVSHLIIGTTAGVVLPLLALWVLQRLGIAKSVGLPQSTKKK